MADYCGVAHGVGCASGSDALLLPLMALGIGAGDEVVTTRPYTPLLRDRHGAHYNPRRTRARPVFVDIDAETYNIYDPVRIEAVPDAADAGERSCPRCTLYGQTAEMEAIAAIAERHGLTVIEDAAQAIGSAYGEKRTGGLGHAAAFSFYPSKNLGGFGDAGMVTTNDQGLARQMARLRVHGMEPKYHHHEVGFNSRLDALQAAVLRVKLRHLDAWTEARREVAARYRSLFEEHGLGERIGLPIERPGHFHVYNQYVIRVAAAARDPLRSALSARRIGTEIYYPIPLHLQTCASPPSRARAGRASRTPKPPRTETIAAHAYLSGTVPRLAGLRRGRDRAIL